MEDSAANDPAGAVPALTAELNSQSSEVQAAAIRLLSGIPGPKITTLLVEQFPKLPPPGQVRMLAALADRGDASATPLFVASLKNPDVRAAALSGLGKLGDASSINVLAEAAATSQGAEQTSARTSLYGLRGPAIDKAIVSALESASGKTKVELIMAAGERGISPAADLLIKAVDEKDPDIHREALTSIEKRCRSCRRSQLCCRFSSSRLQRRIGGRPRKLWLRCSRGQNLPSRRRLSLLISPRTEMPARLALLEVMGQTSTTRPSRCCALR